MEQRKSQKGRRKKIIKRQPESDVDAERRERKEKETDRKSRMSKKEKKPDCTWPPKQISFQANTKASYGKKKINTMRVGNQTGLLHNNFMSKR